ncbi:20598_t:CDS:2 [Gigaspora margarita]|uniref:20598_t:CDS:1 n=1 Tax=Gigaspora margarita TaxID=4874 RepID=A0ABM8VVR8_GIGMA|nr:20598_t:CDS:2 [Gigaspora margarita]
MWRFPLKNSKQFFVSHNFFFTLTNNQKLTCKLRFSLPNRTYLPRVRLYNRPSIVKPILFTCFTSGTTYAVALTYSEYKRRASSNRALIEQYNRKETSGISNWVERVFSRQLKKLQDWNVYIEIERNIALITERWRLLNDSDKTLLVLIGINAIVFGMWQLAPLQHLMEKYFVHHPLSGRMFTLLSSVFSHKAAWHFGFNMFALWSFGGVVYRIFDWKKIIGSLGASGAIFSCLGACAMKYPDASVYLIFLPFFPIKIGYALPAVMAFDLYGIISGMTLFDHFAHLAGAIFGILYTKYGQEQYRNIQIILREL